MWRDQMDDSRTSCSEKSQGRRKRGRPKTRMADNVKEYAGMSMTKLCGMAQNRDNWRTFVMNCITAAQP